MDRHDLQIKAVIDSDTGDFGGILSSQHAGVIGPVRGRLPAFLFEKAERKTRGAPQKIANHLARLLHALMAKEHYQEGRNAARIRTADVLSLGNREQPDNVVRQLIRCEKVANEYLAKGDFGDALIYSPRYEPQMPASLILERASDLRLQNNEDGQFSLTADGYGWLCLWGWQRAKYGRIRMNSTFEGTPTAEGLSYLCEG